MRVLLLEAGGKAVHPNVAIPAAFAKQFNTKLDWDYSTEPEPGCDERSLYIPRGKGLGGSSSMNAMLYVRGRPLDYDLWEAQGAPGWGWNDVRPYFLRAENNERGASEHHATGGPLNVMDERSPRQLTGRFLAAAERCRHPAHLRLQRPRAGRRGAGPGHPARTAAAGAPPTPTCARAPIATTSRSSRARQVMRVELEGGRAVGRALPRPARARAAGAADREVILAAGSIGSPQLLMLSGIGPARSPARGRRRRPRPSCRASGRTSRTTRTSSASGSRRCGDSLYGADKPKALAEWVLRRTGPLTSTVAEAFAFVRSRPGLPAPDLQYHFAPAYFDQTRLRRATTATRSPSARCWSRLRAAGSCGCARPIRRTSRASSPTR